MMVIHSVLCQILIWYIISFIMTDKHSAPAFTMGGSKKF